MESDGGVDTSRIKRAAASFVGRPRILPLTCPVRHYAWGGHEYLPALLGRQNADDTPYAELWIGAHPVAPATTVIDGIKVPLDRLFAYATGFALPYLLKILDVRTMLSIQAHPNQQQAAAGFERENAAGIPLTARHRLFKDANHKPEACVALSEFWALHGFKTPEAIAETLDAVPELSTVAPGFRRGLASARTDDQARRELVRVLYEDVMNAPQEVIDRALAPLVARLAGRRDDGRLRKDSPDYWALRATAGGAPPGGHVDRGITSIYLLNLVRLLPGEGLYISAGMLHAYLEGTAVEIMASSDNVLRGGLTPKHVDVPALLSILMFDAGPPSVLVPERVAPGQFVYHTPATEFELSRIDLAADRRYGATAGQGADAIVVIDGEADILGAGDTIRLQRGSAVLVPRGIRYDVRTARAATLFRASVPPR